MAWLLWERAPLSRYLRRRQRGFHETDLQVAGRVLAEPGKEARAGVGDALGVPRIPLRSDPSPMVKRILRTARLMRGRSTSCSPGTSSGKTLQPSSKPGKLSRSGMANVA